MLNIKILAVFILFIAFNQLNAQVSKSYISLGPSLGATNYKGDLDDDFTLRFTKPGLGAVFNWHFHPNFRFRLSYFHGWMGAADSVSKIPARNWRNLSFRSRIDEVSAQLVYDLLGSSRRPKYRPVYTPYVFAGVAVYNYNPQAKLNGTWYNLHDYGTEGQKLPGATNKYSLTQIAIPVGLGFKYKLNNYWDLSLEMGVRKLFTDYLDDVSDRYVDPQEMLRQQGAIPMQLSDRSIFTNFGANYSNSAYRENITRGFKNQKDWYFYTGFIVTYVIEAKDKCPK
jgi:hypothetical protein